ncbi:MFS transporter [Streptomyces collinus]|uniref:MFS transporter n=1 Tax=Streptomyces collinus TaxID=42684 RepID=UPI00364504D8
MAEHALTAPALPSARRRFGPGFRRLWAATTFSGLGDGVRMIALAVLASTITADPLKVSLVTVAGQLPWVLVGPFSGTLIDHWDRYRLLWLCDAARTAVLAGLVMVLLTGRTGLTALVVVAFLLSSVETMAENLAQAVVPDMAAADALDSANSRLLTGQLVTMEFLGPPLGTALFAVAHALPFGLATACFAVSALLVLRVRPKGAAGRGTPLTLRSLGSHTAAGVVWLWRHRLLRTVCLLVALFNFAVLAVLGVAVLYALDTLRLSQTMYGLLMLVIAGGGLIGVVTAPLVVSALGRGRALQLSFALCPASFAVAGWTSHPLVAALALTFVGAAITLGNVLTATLRQTLIPKERFGQVNGAYRLVINGLTPLGGLAGGLVADRFGLRAPFFLAAGLLLLCTLVAVPLLPRRALDDLPEPDAVTGATEAAEG